jgi:uncharacterized membrane protein YozB (DUF420 family)
MAKGDIDTSRIPVDGVGGFGLLAMAAITVYVVPPLRAIGVPTLLGGIVIGLTLVAVRNRRVRHRAVVGAVLAAVAFALAVLVAFAPDVVRWALITFAR